MSCKLSTCNYQPPPTEHYNQNQEISDSGTFGKPTHFLLHPCTAQEYNQDSILELSSYGHSCHWLMQLKKKRET